MIISLYILHRKLFKYSFNEIPIVIALTCANFGKYKNSMANKLVFTTIIEERCKFKKCSRCKCVNYCSHNCQKLHWNIHRVDCQKNC